MADYLIDFYSSKNRLFQSARIVAEDDIGAQNEAKSRAAAAATSFYKITHLQKSGNIMILDSSKKK
jgi:hypothetical protein